MNAKHTFPTIAPSLIRDVRSRGTPLPRIARTSFEMIDRHYASSLTAEMNRAKLHSFRRPTRFLTDGVSAVATAETEA